MIVDAAKGTREAFQPLWNIDLAATNPGTIPSKHVTRIIRAYGQTSATKIPALIIPREQAVVVAADDGELICCVGKRVWPVTPPIYPDHGIKVHGPGLVVTPGSNDVSDPDLSLGE